MHYPRSPVAVGDGGLQPSAVWAVRHQHGADDSIPAWPAARTFQLLTPAVVGRITALVGGPAGPGSTNPSPCGRSGGLPPAQPPSAATPASRHAHRPHLLRPGGASSPPWPATAGPAPPPTARCHVPDTAGHRGCRTAARGCGRPGSANRRSAGCTDTGRRAWASRYRCGPCRSPSRAGWRSLRAGGSSGRSPGVTALGLVARLRPTHQSGGHGHVGAASRVHRRPAGRARRARSRCSRRLKAALLHRRRLCPSSETVGMRTRRPRAAPAIGSAFAGFRFPPDVIVLAVRWYRRFGLSSRDVEELLAERGIEVDHVTVYRWCSGARPCWPRPPGPAGMLGHRWWVDETYVKVAGRWRYGYRAIDQAGQVIDVFVAPRRDATAARRGSSRGRSVRPRRCRWRSSPTSRRCSRPRGRAAARGLASHRPVWQQPSRSRSRQAEGAAGSDARAQAGPQRQGGDRRAWLSAEPTTRPRRARGR
jgi:hypothetical protein